MKSPLVICQDGLRARVAEEILRDLSGPPFHARLCRWDGGTEPFAVIDPAVSEWLTETDHVVIAGLSLHALDRIAMLDDGLPVAAVVILALAGGIPVAAVREGIDPRRWPAVRGSAPRGFSRLLDERMRALEAIGVRLVDRAGLAAELTMPCVSRVVTLADAQRGTVVPKGARLTPSARDWLRENEPEWKQNADG